MRRQALAQRDGVGGTLADLALHIDLSAVHLNNAIDNRQAQSV